MHTCINRHDWRHGNNGAPVKTKNADFALSAKISVLLCHDLLFMGITCTYTTCWIDRPVRLHLDLEPDSVHQIDC